MSDVPVWLQPMAATLTQERFTGPDWIFERKLDGIRVIAFKDANGVRLLSRNRLSQNDYYPALVDAVAKLPVNDIVLDGEATGRAEYHVFDVLWLNGHNVTGLPLDQRQALLRQLPLKKPFQRVEPLEHDSPWDHACREGWEGVIAKRRDSIYEHRRSKAWLKMKCELTHDFVVGGFTDPQGARVGLGALLVGLYEGKDFVYAGKIGTGFDTKMLLDLRTQLDQLEIPKAPFTKATGLPRVRAHWVTPKIEVTVSFIEWTVHGKLRHPRLIAVKRPAK